MRSLESRTTTHSDESVLDMERNIAPTFSSSMIQAHASAGQHSESNAAYFSWSTTTRINGGAEGRAKYFGNLH
ncbi:hypothetical protein ZOSMA_9971G00010, partial [Zostera marina]